MFLFYGCRNPRQDDIYQHETEKARQARVITSVHTAYSRQEGKPKKYVQDLLKEDSIKICDLILKDDAHVFVCGGAAMADDVRKTLQNLLADRLDMSLEGALEFMRKLRSSGRYHEDIFSVPHRNKDSKENEEQKGRFE